MNTKITFVELVGLIAQATSSSERLSELFLREFFNTISQALIDGETVKIKGIGTFKVSKIKNRKAANDDGDEEEPNTHNRVTFVPDKSLAEALNNPFAQFESVTLDDKVTDEQLDEIDRLYPSYFLETGDLPEPPDFPTPPALNGDVIPTVAPTMPASPEPVKPQPKAEPVKPLMGIPIDGPSHRSSEPAQAKPIPSPSVGGASSTDEDDDHFYRPAPRNIYTPTQEQIETQQSSPLNKRWLWIALGVLAVALMVWGLTRCHGKSDNASGDTAAISVVADSTDSVAPSEPAPQPKVETNDVKNAEQKVEKVEAQEPPKTEPAKKPEPDKKPEGADKAQPRVVTDVVTDQIVLVTLAEKHYGSPWFWVYIYDENRDKISNPNNIKPGTRVVIPPPEKYGINAKDPSSVKKAQRLSWQYLK